jgi:hypothetical protein
MYISSPFLCNAAITASSVKDKAALKLPLGMHIARRLVIDPQLFDVYISAVYIFVIQLNHTYKGKGCNEATYLEHILLDCL